MPGPKASGYLTDVPKYSVGHWTDEVGATGCTVVLCPSPTIGGVCVCGGGPATREIATLEPIALRSSVDAVLITGGSIYGLSAAEGVYRYLKESVFKRRRSCRRIPIVPTVALFDLRVGQKEAVPLPDHAYQACAETDYGRRFRGSVGAAAGATVGKVRGIKWATKGGLGSSSFSLDKGVIIGCIVVVNAFGDVRNPSSGKVIAGARDGHGFIDTAAYIRKRGLSYLDDRQNTTICVVATNANLNKAEVNKVAQMASAGIARVVSPCWTEYDGDIVIALAGGKARCDYNLIGILAAELVAEAIVDAVTSATSLAGIPSASELAEKFTKCH